MNDKKSLALQEVLKFAIGQTETNVSNTSLVQVDEDRKAFFENALKSMTVDVMEQLLLAKEVLEKPDSTDAEKCNALHSIRDYIDNIDFANNFVKLGSANILKSCLQSENSEIRSEAINIVAEMSQNNPFCQQHFLENDFFALLLKDIKVDDEISASILYAISGMVKNFEPGFRELIKLDGLRSIVHCLQTSLSRVFIKATFLISTLCSDFPIARDQLISMSAFDKLSEYLEVVTDFDIKTEGILQALVELSGSPEFHIKHDLQVVLIEKLKNIISKNQDLPQCEEIVNYSRKLIERITSMDFNGTDE